MVTHPGPKEPAPPLGLTTACIRETRHDQSGTPYEVVTFQQMAIPPREDHGRDGTANHEGVRLGRS